MLGYAFILPEELDTDDGVKLVPCLQDDVNTLVIENDADHEAMNDRRSIREVQSKESIDRTEVNSSTLKYAINDKERRKTHEKTESDMNSTEKSCDDGKIDSYDKEQSGVVKSSVSFGKSENQYRKAGRGKFDVFLDFVEKSKLDDGTPRKIQLRKVRCILCGDGRTHSYGNVRKHIESQHFPPAPVFCEICNSKFSQKRCLVVHKKKMHKIENMEVNNNGEEEKKDDPKEYNVFKSVPARRVVNPKVRRNHVNSSISRHKYQHTFIKPYSKPSNTKHSKQIKTKSTSHPPAIGSSEVNNNAGNTKETQPDQPRIRTGLIKSQSLVVTHAPSTRVYQSSCPSKIVATQSCNSIVTQSPSYKVSQSPSFEASQSTNSLITRSSSSDVTNTSSSVVTQLPDFMVTKSLVTVVTSTDSTATVTPPDNVVTTRTLETILPSFTVTPKGGATVVTQTEEHPAVETDSLVSITMISISRGTITLGLQKDFKIKKAMRKFGTRYDVDHKKLRFVLERTRTELTGNEIAGNMKETNIKVYGD